MSWLGMVHCGQLIATDLSKVSDWGARPDLQAAARGLIAVPTDGAGGGEPAGS